MTEKGEAAAGSAAEEEQPQELPYDVDERGRFRAVLPSGKRPIIKPVHPAKIRRIHSAYPQPEPPTVLVEIKGSGMAQRLPKEKDPDYLKQRAQWLMDIQVALLTRYAADALVVPEDADFTLDGEPRIAMPDCPLHWQSGNEARWKRMGLSKKLLHDMLGTVAQEQDVEDEQGEVSKQLVCACVPAEEDWSAMLRATNVPVPENGLDRQLAYIEEALPDLLTEMPEQSAFISAVHAISVPTEAGIEAARRRFRDQMARSLAGRLEDTEGRDQDSAGA